MGKIYYHRAMGYCGLAFGSMKTHFEPLRPERGGKWIYGAWVAQPAYYRALLRYGVLQRLDFCMAELGLNPRRSRTIRVEGRDCRQWPLSSLCEPNSRSSYDAVLTTIEEIHQAVLRNAYLPASSVVANVHSLNYSFLLASVGMASLMRLFWPHDAIICSSRAARRTVASMFDYWDDHLRRLGRGGVGNLPALPVIPYGVELPSRVGNRAPARRDLGFPDKEVVILSFGRLSVPDKADYAALLAPVAMLIRSRPAARIRLVLAGEDPNRVSPALIKLGAHLGIRRNLRVLPDVDSALRATLYETADIFLSLPDNVQESFGLVLIEAMSFGLPVVASDWDGYRDIVAHGRTGFLVPTAWGGSMAGVETLSCLHSQGSAQELARRTVVDPGAVEKALGRLVDSPGLRRTMGEAGFRRARERFTWEAVAAQHGELWDELAELRRRSTAKQPAGHRPAGMQDYARIFGHYPSGFITGNHRVRLSAGWRRNPERNPLFAVQDRETAEVAWAALQTLRGGGKTTEELCTDIAESRRIGADSAMSVLLLAGKYGLVEFR